MAKVDRRSDDECWRWEAGRNSEGYGLFRHKGKNTTAHRAVYELLVGPIPSGTQLDHTCHGADSSCQGGKACPHRSCCNPAHLEPVSQRVNILRGRAPQAANAAKTHCIHGHELTPDNLVPSKPYRVCRTCHNRRQKERYERLKGRPAGAG